MAINTLSTVSLTRQLQKSNQGTQIETSHGDRTLQLHIRSLSLGISSSSRLCSNSYQCHRVAPTPSLLPHLHHTTTTTTLFDNSTTLRTPHQKAVPPPLNILSFLRSPSWNSSLSYKRRDVFTTWEFFDRRERMCLCERAFQHPCDVAMVLSESKPD